MTPLLRRVACAAALAVAACTPHVPPIVHPASIDSFCASGNVAYGNAMGSVMSSTDDVLLPDRPTFAGIRKLTSAGNGAIAHWDDQVLLAPRTAAALGEPDSSVHVRSLAVPPPPEQGATSRLIYLEARDHGTYRWIAMRAYDVEDICVIGKVQS